MAKDKDASRKQQATQEGFEAAARDQEGARYVLRLYVTGMSPRSRTAIENLRAICDRYLQGRCEMEVVDLLQHPERAREAQVIAAPTLVKELPLPMRKLLGDLSNTDKVLIGLDLVGR